MEGHLERDGHRTWYRIVGELDPEALHAPVVICHGGPGATHHYVAPIAELHRSGRACVLYDQLGNGNSDHLPDADASFWTTQLFKDELAALVDHLGIAGRYHVLGQSWGGMLAMDHALDQPPGLLSVVAADSPANADAFARGAVALLDTLPPGDEGDDPPPRGGRDDRRPRVRGRGAGVLHALRVPPGPVARRARRELRRDGGRPDRLRHDERPERVHGGRRAARVGHRRPPRRDRRPAAAHLGRATTRCRPEVVRVIDETCADSEWVLFEGCSHTPHLEAPDRFLRTVEQFLERVEAPAR